MSEEFEQGDEVEVAYESKRSGNVVSRKGPVVQVPEENGTTVLFVETDENQLTGVKSEYAFSVSVTSESNTEDGSRTQRIVPLGRLESVHSR
ncbi:hypothetical protein OB955_04900 [Halobacteria archaeon AArc-m2/3/4]|uniref:Hypervirulence associated protein TUDOR domain-containing protein n=1 Tax=Natronoglomus mannanivorans TaxID=2979990 RepID=A0ABT2QAZ1_9EURY|nr:hypothetical protein [Halobacteria archaeon AArc-m2/3/4]